MSNALVDLARALVGWLRGGLGMSVIVVSYFFLRHLRLEDGRGLGARLDP